MSVTSGARARNSSIRFAAVRCPATISIFILSATRAAIPSRKSGMVVNRKNPNAIASRSVPSAPRDWFLSVPWSTLEFRIGPCSLALLTQLPYRGLLGSNLRRPWIARVLSCIPGIPQCRRVRRSPGMPASIPMPIISHLAPQTRDRSGCPVRHYSLENAGTH